MSRLYSNENVALPVVTHLRELGHDVDTSVEAGNANQRISDAEILGYAHESGRVLLTNNRQDFIALHRAGSPHRGIVVFTSDVDFAALAARIHSALEEGERRERPPIRVTRGGFTIE